MNDLAQHDLPVSPSPPAADLSRRRGALWRCLPEMLVLAAGLATTLAIYWLIGHWEAQRRADALRDDAEVYTRAIERELQGLVTSVESIAGFYSASEDVTASEFAVFSRPLLRRDPTVQALAWVPRVPDADRDAFEASARAQGLAGFAIREGVAGQLRPEGRRPEYFPIYRLAPASGNALALGFDLGSEPVRRAALERARDSGRPAATAPLTLVQEIGDQRGLAIYVPQASEDAPGDAPRDSRQGIAGFATGAVRFGALTEGVLSRLPRRGIDLVVRDAAVAGDAGLLYVHLSRTRASGAKPDWAALVRAPRAYRTRIAVADRTLELWAVPAPGAYPPAAWPSAILGLGLAVSIALAALLRYRRRAAARLREQEGLFRLFMDHSPTVAWIKDEQGRFVYLNRTFERSFGTRLDDWRGKTDFDVWPADVAARFHAGTQAVLAADRPMETVGSVPTGEGGVRHWQTIKIPFRDELGRRFVGGIGMDITDRRQAEEALRASEERLRLAIDAAGLGAYDWDLATGRTIWSSHHARLWGYAPDKRDTDYATFAARVHPEDLARFEAEVARAMAGRERCRAEYRVLWPDGSLHWIFGLGEFERDEAGRPRRMRGVVMEITERKRFEQELRQSEERLRESERRWKFAIEGSAQGLWDVDLIADQVYYSPSYLSLLGYNEEDFGASVSAWSDRVHPDDLEGALDLGYRHLRGESEFYESELRMRCKDGSYRWTLSRGKLMERTPDGRPKRFIGTMTDIGERKAAEAAIRRLNAELEQRVAARTAELAASESKLRTIYDLLPIGIAITDSAGRIVDCNRASETLLGLSLDQLLQRTFGEGESLVVRPDDTPMPIQEFPCMRATLERRMVRDVEMGLVRPEGILWLSVSAVPSTDPDYGVVIAFADITARRKARAELEASEAKARAIIDAAPVPMALADETGATTYVNAAFTETFGYTLEDIPTWADWRIKATPDPAYREWIFKVRQERLERVRREGGLFEPLEAKVCCKDGSVRTVMARATPLGSGFEERLNTIYDITDLKRAQEEALQATRMKSELLANMSHEIRTPMNAVLGMAQLLERDALTDDQRGMVQRIRAAGQSLLALINDILDFSKIEAGALRLEKKPFALADILAQIQSLMGRMAHSKGLVLRIEAPQRLADRLSGDPLRLEQILLNLVGNAVKFTERGEVRLRILAEERGDTAVRLNIEVSDTGIGIDPERLSTMFAPFTQADSSIARRFGGTGLGLSIVKRLVDLMGGTIGVESQVGVGSRFRLELPFERAGADAAPPSPGSRLALPTGPRLCGIHCLVVDDSLMNLDLVGRMLVREGARATLVADGRQALDHLRAHPGGCDLVLMDIQMPEVDGLAATRAIRGELGLAGLPVIAFSAGGFAEQRAEALAAGLDDFLLKPVDLDDLVATLRRFTSPADPIGAAAASAPAPGCGADFPEIPGLDTRQAARFFGNDRTFFLDRLRHFAADFRMAGQGLREAISRGQFAEAIRQLRRLRGNAGYLGAVGLVQAALDLETGIGQGLDSAALLDRVEWRLDALLEAFEPWIDTSFGGLRDGSCVNAPDAA